MLAAGTSASMADTIGQKIAKGSMSPQQVQQLVQFTGLSVEEAKAYTVEDVAKLRWLDD